MPYKIIKYAGKTKIKDTKTGESQEIDIEKFMKGGYKTPEYMDGVEFGCPPNDFECLERERLGLSPHVSSELEGFNPQLPLNDETTVNQASTGGDPFTAKPSSQFRGNIDLEGLRNSVSDPSELLQNNISQKLPNEGLDTTTPKVPNREIEEADYHINNLYAGVDIPGAANYLGQSIKNKDTFGTISSGLKLATGLGRNIVSGLGQANRYNQVVQDYYKDQKNNRHPIQYQADGGYLESFAYGGKKDEELAIGEYMHGVSNEETEQYNAEIERGEYFQSNQGDIAEVVGDKHSQGGEKIQMEANDRVLSDKLKLGGKMAKELSEKYDMKLKAKDTYSTVLDKFRKKSKLDKILNEEAEIVKKIAEQDKIEDATTRDFNLEVLSKKKAEIAEKKHPIEEQRKEIFEELFNIQEDSKPKDKKSNQPDLAFGGDLSALAQEYNIPLERAQQLVQEFEQGGKMVPKYMDGVKIGDIDPRTGKKVTREEAEQKVESGEWEDLGGGNYVDRGTSSTTSTSTGKGYRTRWNEMSEEEQANFGGFEDFREKAEAYNQRTVAGTPDEFFYSEETKAQVTPQGIVRPSSDILANVPPYIPSPTVAPLDSTGQRDRNTRQGNGIGTPLFPDEQPLPPTNLQGTIKPVARFDRLRANEIEVEPYLQDIRDREQAQVQSLEGLSPNVRAAVLANVRANSQTQESGARNQIDTQNLQNRQRVEDSNAQIQRQESILENNYRQGYEQRIYQAQANTDNDIRNYYNQLQKINSQRFEDINELNLTNAQDESIYFDGQRFRRKQGQTDRDLIKQLADRYQN